MVFTGPPPLPDPLHLLLPLPLRMEIQHFAALEPTKIQSFKSSRLPNPGRYHMVMETMDGVGRQNFEDPNPRPYHMERGRGGGWRPWAPGRCTYMGRESLPEEVCVYI